MITDKKAMVLSVCFFYAFLAGANGTAYTSGGHAVEAEFNTNPYVYLLGLTSLMTCTYSYLVLGCQGISSNLRV